MVASGPMVLTSEPLTARMSRTVAMMLSAGVLPPWHVGKGEPVRVSAKPQRASFLPEAPLASLFFLVAPSPTRERGRPCRRRRTRTILPGKRKPGARGRNGAASAREVDGGPGGYNHAGRRLRFGKTTRFLRKDNAWPPPHKPLPPA